MYDIYLAWMTFEISNAHLATGEKILTKSEKIPYHINDKLGHG